jgi:ubiquitin carboxyl-terminal hydrolase 48
MAKRSWAFDLLSILEAHAIIDWRLARPKMHVPSQADPPPDAYDFRGHVECEHNGLGLNTTSRRRISIEVA